MIPSVNYTTATWPIKVVDFEGYILTMCTCGTTQLQYTSDSMDVCPNHFPICLLRLVKMLAKGLSLNNFVCKLNLQHSLILCKFN